MIKIYIESGVSAAGKKNKRTTPECDFLEKYIQYHFPQATLGVDYTINGLGGKDTLEASSPVLRDMEPGDHNLIIFDADSPHNHGGFANRQTHIYAQRTRLGLTFDLFLWPNNQDDGDFESMLLNLINPEHSGIIQCYERFEMCVGGQDPDHSRYSLPGRKGEVYTYIEIQKLTPEQRKLLSSGYYLFDNPDYWNLDAPYCASLKSFLSQYLCIGNQV